LQASGSASSIIDWSIKSNLDLKQRRAFEIITSSFILSYYDPALIGSTHSRSRYNKERYKLQMLVHNATWKSDQLICLIHGPGGCGKTVLIDLVLLYAHEFCSYLWADFKSSERVIVVTAITGVAATILQGQTTHAALYLNQMKTITPEQIDIWLNTKMVIIDEVSFADKADIIKMESHLCKLKQTAKKYGGVNVVFCGDFCQLEPVGFRKKPLYEDNVPQFRDYINCLFEFDGIWRFKNDPAWGKLLSKIRYGIATKKDIEIINCQIVKNRTVPATVQYACYFNRDKDAINTAIFEDRINYSYEQYGTTAGYMLIFADNIQIQNASKIFKNFSDVHTLYESCSANDIKMGNRSGKMDLVLKVYSGCKVMLPTNINVEMGQANGTQATVEQIVLKPNIQPIRTLIGGVIPVAAVFASQVEYIVLRHANAKIDQALFNIQPKRHSFKLKLPSSQQLQKKITYFDANMRAIQLPILQNNATTGHKLQGSGVESLFVHKWSNVTNWNYVMLSRVKSMTGLYAGDRLPVLDMTIYKLKPAYETMMSKFRTKMAVVLTDEDYANILK
jgi:PIF1-like helicase